MLHCVACGRNYSVLDGIPILLDMEELDQESRHEMACRDFLRPEETLERPKDGLSEWDRMEMEPTLKAMNLNEDGGLRVLEFGCGKGRYTLFLAECGIPTVALDFSMNSLRFLARLLPSEALVGLVQANATRRCVSPRSFDRALSTLVSNLPTQGHRSAMFQVAAEALKDTGSLVYSVHHQNLARRMRGIPQAGRYAENDIFSYYMRSDEIQRESKVCFRRTTVQPIQIAMPLIHQTLISAYTFSRIAERVPIFRQQGSLLLVIATEPISRNN
jgi:cyclopropane fatty-acyl-phospholipid synthase-like methyltransferase